MIVYQTEFSDIYMELNDISDLELRTDFMQIMRSKSRFRIVFGLPDIERGIFWYLKPANENKRAL
jgi:hypothetical protein